MLDFIFKRQLKINATIITKQAKLINITRYPDGSTFDFNKGSYTIIKEARLNKDNVPAFIYIEGIPDPINFNNLKKPSDLKIDSEGLKAVLKAKLFYELFNDANQQIKDIIMYVMLGLILIGIGYLAFATDKNMKSILEVKNFITSMETAKQLLTGVTVVQ